MEHVPIKDGGVPDKAATLPALVRKLLGLLAEGRNVAVHCRAGAVRCQRCYDPKLPTNCSAEPSFKMFKNQIIIES